MIHLTMLGSRGVSLHVHSSAVLENPDGATIWIHHTPGHPAGERSAYTLTRQETHELIDELEAAVNPR